jgi:peptidoglycan/LPS O-acetylase OafA/YrhL
LVLLVLATVLCFGPAMTTLSLADYFGASETWRYLSTAALLVRRGLPGVFVDNPYPQAVNGSLWTLPVEFLCYVSVALIGSIRATAVGLRIGAGLGIALLAAAVGSRLLGERFVAHFEMVAFFWWGVLYAWLGTRPALGRPQSQLVGVAIAVGLTLFVVTSPRGAERTAMLLCAAALVVLARRYSLGARLTDRLGDLSYGMYIFAFPVQQLMVVIGRGRNWSFEANFTMSLLVTSALAYASWHLIERRALRFKPKSGAVNRAAV